MTVSTSPPVADELLDRYFGALMRATDPVQRARLWRLIGAVASMCAAG